MLGEPSQRSRFFTQFYKTPWVVYTKKPFGGPQQVLDYLGRYTHRIAISNNRLLSVDDACVRIRYKDYAHGNRRKVMSLEAEEFIRRFLLHFLPAGFKRIRHYGLIANCAKRAKLAQTHTALAYQSPPRAQQPESVEAFWLRVAKLDIHQCQHCRTGHMIVIGSINPALARAPPGS